MLTLLLLLACSGGQDGPAEPEVDPYAPPPLPEGLKVDETQQALVAIVGHSIEPSQVGDWIGMAEDVDELRERLFAASVVPVEGMTLRVGPWPEDMVKLLVNSPELQSLVRLEASGAELGPAGGTLLVATPWMAQIEQLRLNESGIDEGVVVTLAEQPSLAQLKELGLANNGLRSKAVTALMEAQGLKALERLDLSGNRVGDAGARALAASARSGTLKELDLRDNGLSDEGAVYLASARGLADIERLDLRGNRITEKGRDALLGTYAEGVLVLE